MSELHCKLHENKKINIDQPNYSDKFLNNLSYKQQ